MDCISFFTHITLYLAISLLRTSLAGICISIYLTFFRRLGDEEDDYKKDGVVFSGNFALSRHGAPLDTAEVLDGWLAENPYDSTSFGVLGVLAPVFDPDEASIWIRVISSISWFLYTLSTVAVHRRLPFHMYPNQQFSPTNHPQLVLGFTLGCRFSPTGSVDTLRSCPADHYIHYHPPVSISRYLSPHASPNVTKDQMVRMTERLETLDEQIRSQTRKKSRSQTCRCCQLSDTCLPVL